MSDTISSTYTLLRDQNFRHFILSRTANGMGIHMLTVVVGWHVYELTKDPLDLGYIGLAQFAPHFVFFLLEGLAADGFDGRFTLAVWHAIHLIAVALLMVCLL
mgnify:CR=1 FL=1